MVLLHVKRSDKDTFLYETPAASEVDAVLREVVAIHNLRCKVNRLAEAAEGLAAHGPMKPPEQQGLDDETPLLEDYDVKTGIIAGRSKPERNENYRPDPTEKRTGNAPPGEIAAVISRTVDDAKALVSERQVSMKVVASSKALEDAINNIKGATMIAFPMGLPDYDPVRQILENRESLEGAAQLQVVDESNASLWCFNKELVRDKLLCEYVGRNEKTKVVAKLQKKGAGAPQREPVVRAALPSPPLPFAPALSSGFVSAILRLHRLLPPACAPHVGGGLREGVGDASLIPPARPAMFVAPTVTHPNDRRRRAPTALLLLPLAGVGR